MTAKKMISYTEILKYYFANYLRDIRGLSESSVKHYFDALNNISRRLKEKGLVKKDIYEVKELGQLEGLKEILYADPDFIESNERGRRMYSAGLNNYCRFASGADFQKAKDRIALLDIPVAKPEEAKVTHKEWVRSGIIRTQVMEMADFQCEIDTTHESFICESTSRPYMEGHHAIPMRLQMYFDCSLDIYANLVCLCPVCHRRIHYGIKEDRRQMMNRIYNKRSERLVKSGIVLSKEEFFNTSICLGD